MAAPQQVRAVPLARALRLRTRASAAPAAAPETSRRALLGLTEPELRQLAVDLGQVTQKPEHPRARKGAAFFSPFLPSPSFAGSLTRVSAAKLPGEAAARPRLQEQGQAGRGVRLW